MARISKLQKAFSPREIHFAEKRRQGSVVLFHYNSIGNQFLRSVKKSRMLVFRNMEMSSLNSNIISFPAVADKMEVWITPSSYYVFEFFSLTRPAHSGVSAFASKLNGGTLVAYRSYTKINYHLSLVMRAIGSPSECGIRYYN